LSIIPPVFLDWGYRSTDFLRFFTAAFSFSAMLLGWSLGWLWERGPHLARVAVLSVCICTLINPFIIGVLGLKRSTFAAVQDLSQKAGSLHEAALAEKGSSDTEVLDSLTMPQRRAAALAVLAEQTRRYLYPQTLGRERAIVIVPLDQLPPTEVFPEWLKLATLSHVQLPIGWHWSDSVYAAYYRDSVTKLSPASIAALDAHWVIVTNLFSPAPPRIVLHELRDRRRFIPACSFVSGDYYLSIYRALSFSEAPLNGE
jgi:hypothetical protein